MVLIFDLDDTLYDETTYVRSGFKAASEYLSTEYKLSNKNINIQLLDEFKLGRGKIFDNVLQQNNIFSKKLVKKCLSIYRLHLPEISLSKSAENCLKRFDKYPLYIVTDGNKVVQYNKIKALGLENQVKSFYITHRYGIHNSKPSPYCFLKICEREQVLPEKVVYIADNISKDFVGIKPLGFKTIQVKTGQYASIKKPVEYHADLQIDSLDELTELLLSKYFGK